MDPLNGFNGVVFVFQWMHWFTGLNGCMSPQSKFNGGVIVCHWMHWCAAVNCCNGPTQWLQSTGDSVSLDALVHVGDWVQWTH